MATKMNEAIGFIAKVKQDIGQNGTRAFMTLLKDFQSAKLSVDEVKKQALTIFEGHPKLLAGFNDFLPADARLPIARIQPDIDAPPLIANAFSDITPGSVVEDYSVDMYRGALKETRQLIANEAGFFLCIRSVHGTAKHVQFTDQYKAMLEFEVSFYEATLNLWIKRREFIPYSGRVTRIELPKRSPLSSANTDGSTATATARSGSGNGSPGMHAAGAFVPNAAASATATTRPVLEILEGGTFSGGAQEVPSFGAPYEDGGDGALPQYSVTLPADHITGESATVQVSVPVDRPFGISKNPFENNNNNNNNSGGTKKLSSYLEFVKDIRPKLVAAHPNMSNSELSKMIADIYKVQKQQQAN